MRKRRAIGSDHATLFAVQDPKGRSLAVPVYQALPSRGRNRVTAKQRLIAGITLSALGAFAMMGAVHDGPDRSAVSESFRIVADHRDAIRVVVGGAAIVGALILLGTAERLTRE